MSNSLSTWKAEFYPVDSSEVPKGVESICHSLQKWIGTLPENIEKHNCVINGYYIFDINHKESCFYLDNSTCSLCHSYYSTRNDMPCSN